MTWLIILLALWTYPIITFFLTRLTKNKVLFKKRLIRITLIITILSIVGLITNVSTTIKAIDWILITTIYFLSCMMLWFAYFKFKKIWKSFVIIIMIGIYSIGYLSGTIGALAIGFIINDYDPKRELWLGNGLIYKEINIGNAISKHHSKRVEIFKTITWFPLIEWKIIQKEYSDYRIYASELKVDYKADIKTICLSITDISEGKNNSKIWSDTLVLEEKK